MSMSTKMHGWPHTRPAGAPPRPEARAETLAGTSLRVPPLLPHHAQALGPAAKGRPPAMLTQASTSRSGLA